MYFGFSSLLRWSLVWPGTWPNVGEITPWFQARGWEKSTLRAFDLSPYFTSVFLEKVIHIFVGILFVLWDEVL